MANIPCPNVSRCDCDNSPLGNFSSEAPDELTYYAMSWITPKPRIGQNPDDAVGPGRPPVTCGSTTSPTAAQQCADRDSYINGNNNITPNLPVVLNSTVSCVAFCPDGSFTIGSADPGTFVNQDASVANGQAQAEACRLAVLNRICLSNISGQACVGTLFSVQVVASSTSPVTFSIITGSLPPGVIIVPLSPTSIFLAGVPTTAGNYSFNLRAANTSGFTAIKAYTISVMGIVNDSPLADATEGDAYVAIITAAGGTAPYSFGVVVGALPAGLTLDPSGLLQGTPTADGDFNFTIEVTDSAAQTCRKAFTLHVEPGQGCYVFDTSVNLGAYSILDGWCAYGTTSSVLNPKRVFFSIDADQLGVIDADLNTVIHVENYGTGDEFRELVYSSENERVIIATLKIGVGNSYYRIVNANTYAPIAVVDCGFGNQPRCMRYCPEKSKVFATLQNPNAEFQSLDVLTNILTNTTLATPGDDSIALVYRPSVNRIYILSEKDFNPNYIRVIDGDTYAPITTIASGQIGTSSARGICYSSSNDRLYVTIHDGGIPNRSTIFCVNPDTGLAEFSLIFDTGVEMAEQTLLYDSVRDYVWVATRTLLGDDITVRGLKPATNTFDCVLSGWDSVATPKAMAVGNGKLFIPETEELRVNT